MIVDHYLIPILTWKIFAIFNTKVTIFHVCFSNTFRLRLHTYKNLISQKRKIDDIDYHISPIKGMIERRT